MGIGKSFSSRAFQFFAVAIIGGLCLVLDNLTQIRFNKMDLPRNSPQYNATQISASVYSKTGSLIYSVSGEEAWEFPNSDKVYIKNIVLRKYNESNDQLQYEVTSDDSWIDRKTKDGFLGKNVVAKVIESNPEQNIVLTGDNFKLSFADDTIDSSENAHAVQGKNEVYTHGFKYNNKTKYLQLLSNVKVIYVLQQ